MRSYFCALPKEYRETLALLAEKESGDETATERQRYAPTLFSKGATSS
jgi:hypothetical protein